MPTRTVSKNIVVQTRVYMFHAKMLLLFLGLATVHPQPKDCESFIKAQLYDTNYKSSIPPIYAWPKL